MPPQVDDPELERISPVPSREGALIGAVMALAAKGSRRVLSSVAPTGATLFEPVEQQLLGLLGAFETSPFAYRPPDG